MRSEEERSDSNQHVHHLPRPVRELLHHNEHLSQVTQCLMNTHRICSKNTKAALYTDNYVIWKVKVSPSFVIEYFVPGCSKKSDSHRNVFYVFDVSLVHIFTVELECSSYIHTAAVYYWFMLILEAVVFGHRCIELRCDQATGMQTRVDMCCPLLVRAWSSLWQGHVTSSHHYLWITLMGMLDYIHPFIELSFNEA